MDKKILIVIFVIIVIIVIIICSIVYLRIKGNEPIDIEYISESGAEYDRSQLNNFDFQLTNIPQELEENIDLEELNMQVKEYLYEKGLITANTGEIEEYNNNGQTIELIIKLNDEENSEIKLTIKAN